MMVIRHRSCKSYDPLLEQALISPGNDQLVAFRRVSDERARPRSGRSPRTFRFGTY